jgi:hypothetical protein
VWGLAVVFALVVPCGARAEDAKESRAIDGGKAEAFKGKTFDLKPKEKAAITLTFPAGKTFSVTVRSKKESDIHLFIYDSAKKEVARDDSPGPSCDITFTPKAAGKYTLVIVNKGPGSNSSTLEVEAGKKQAGGKE